MGDDCDQSSSRPPLTHLYHEVLDHSVDESIVVVSLKSELDEVATGQRSFSRPKFNVDVTVGGMEKYLARGGRLREVDVGHTPEKS